MKAVYVTEDVKVCLSFRNAVSVLIKSTKAAIEGLVVVFVAMGCHVHSARVAELVRAHPIGRIGQYHVKLVGRASLHPLKGVSVNCSVEVGSEGSADFFAKRAVLRGGFLAPEELERFVDSLGGGDFGVVQMVSNDKLATSCLLVDASG
jgi:hypothetical protein